MVVLCNNCGCIMKDLVVSDGNYQECHIRMAYDSDSPYYWLYICPRCGNIQAEIIEEDDE